MRVGHTFFEVKNFTDDQSSQYIAKSVIVDPATINITVDSTGTLQFEEKAPASSPHQRYRLEPEGDLYRVVAQQKFFNRFCGPVKPGERGGLVAGYDNLAQEGTAWLSPGSVVTSGAKLADGCYIGGSTKLSGTVHVADYAFVVDSVLAGTTRIDGNASIHDSYINTEPSVRLVAVGGNTILAACNVQGKDEGFTIAGGQMKKAQLRGINDFVTVWTRWGWLTAFRRSDDQMVTQVGCQNETDIAEFREIASEYHANPVELAMLEGFIVMANAMAGGWQSVQAPRATSQPEPVPLPRLAPDGI